MGRVNQAATVEDKNGDGILETADGYRGLRIEGIDGTELLRADTEADGTSPGVVIPTDLLVQGETIAADDSVVGDLSVEDGNFVLLRADATAGTPVVQIDADLELSGEVLENQTL